MSPLTPYLALALFPATFFVAFVCNPIEFSWSFHHGLKAMPEEIRDRAETVNRYLNLLMAALDGGLVWILMLKSSVPARLVGLNLDNWKSNIAVGSGAGILLISAQVLMVKLSPINSRGPFAYRVRRGLPLLWIIILIAGAFSEELWVAFCLIAFRTTGHSASTSVAATVIVFALVHYGYGLGGSVAVALKETVSALFFLRYRSLIVPFSFHFIGNLGSFYWHRYWHRSESVR